MEAISTLRIWAKASVERSFINEKRICLIKSNHCGIRLRNCHRDFFHQDDRALRLAKIKSALKFYLEDSERVFEQGMLNESIRLLGFQKTLILDIMKSYGSSGTSSTNQAHDP
ncbi:hypothetical protein Pst134EA_032436 [Puccinia striiformis f. sp. tritici]|uniref:uncharacterized protein n=1 Tax=Puccinia striiformis f. sp. tritici TaxID=168172 RepID=UPI00200856AC|nr:uncharacterized protein Pst134EA_032436 [Puccinia striiformis f. sp. tritici]KAH9444264.1 hypothetical protein Pst134EA_032436 [Puccinia striiformis f. sp. tritici]